jgi:hypothetical protein
LGELDAPAPDPDVSRHTEGALERATEVADAEVEGRSKILDDDFAGKVGVDMCCEPSRLPAREAPAQDLPWANVVGLPGSSRFRTSVQER